LNDNIYKMPGLFFDRLRIIFMIVVLIFPLFHLKSQNKSDTLTVIGVGDIMPGTNFPTKQYLPPDSGKNIFKPVSLILENADVTFGNLEGCLLNSGGTVKKCQDSSKCYAFRIPPYFASIIKDAGFDVLNLANNHSNDFGEAGRINTMKVLDSMGIFYAGLLSCPYVIFTKNNLKIGFCGVSPFTGTLEMKSADTIRQLISHLDSVCDVVIVSMHAGAEGADHAHVTRQTEMFYDEDRGNVYEFAHFLVDAGADIVLGHGPHITRAVELYKNRFIAYSLGNFCTYGRFNLKDVNGIAPIMKVFTNRSGEFLKARVYSIIQKGEGGPVLDDSDRAVQQLTNLTNTDFPENSLVISKSGEICRKQ
jgi:poly-gamma-glutamate capsule biosynthesis protein CapA/YwtB (metallophosphatase superfamily)